MTGQRLIGAIAILVAGCSGPSSETHSMQSPTTETFDVEEPPAEMPSPAATGPKIAYSYSVTYAFDRRTVAQVQGQQLDLCRRLGPARCLIVRSSLNTPGPDEHVVHDEAVLMVDARQAEALTRRFDAIAEAGDARRASRQVEAEDVTRQVIDTEARVRAKQALAERLLAIIRSGNGKVGDLVEAERAYATTNEELEAAKAQRAELAQRVAMSKLTIAYAFNDVPGGNSPVMASIEAAGATLSTSVAALVTFVVAALPWIVVAGLMLFGLRRVARRRGWRWPWRRGERSAG
ncbi:DUF4349 domain-containing protein [uncultured Sphingomonas sp.]|uniref:DUF4349 domain-containing protein n=1 Tax=uncultured Sphingomonas sp. TaxID=158754 RepID=UPI0025EEC0B2|nr:DUF4349 domain-containing protein [uncultured Sphingomonas sp.]